MANMILWRVVVGLIQSTVGTPSGPIYLEGEVRKALTENVTLALAQRSLKNIKGR